MADPIGIRLMQDHELLRTRRSSYDNYMSDIKEFVRPASPDFYGSGQIQPVRTNVKCFDSTAMWAAEQLAAGYAGFLVPANDRWADLILDEDRHASYEEAIWLDNVSDLLFREWGDPLVRFNSAMQEGFNEVASFGTDIIYQDVHPVTQKLYFKAFPIADCWLRENYLGQIDTVHRSTIFTTRQLYQQFDHSVLNGIERISKDKEKNYNTYEVIHVVCPADDELVSKMRVKKPWASFYILRESRDVIRSGGYDFFPYHVGREKVVAGHVYGQSCAFTMLPAIKMLNAMMRTVIKAGNKMIDPPVMAPSDGFVVPLRSDPGAIWWYDASSMNPEAVKQFPFQGGFQISDNLIADVRDQITRGFHVDWLIRNKKNERQTATEIMDDRDEMLRQLSPTLSRMETEKIASIVKHSYMLMRREGRLPPAPESLRGTKINVKFQSPLARAQYGARGTDIQRYINDLTPMLNLWPSMLDTLNPDEISRYLARVRNIPSQVLNDDEAVEMMRQQREAEAQMQQMMAGAPAMGKTLKDVSEATAISEGM